MNLKNIVVDVMSKITGTENVVSSNETMLEADPILIRNFNKAFVYTPEHLPLCIVKPIDAAQISKVLKYCNENDIHVIPVAGGSSGEDQLLVVDDRTIYIDCSRMDQVLDINTCNMTVTVQSGVPLAKLEEKLNEMGFTTGHTPQSLPLASMGGLVATRSIGQYSTLYGGIEDLVCGLEAVLPNGEIFRIREVPRRAAGPDLRHLVIGAEGTIAYITEVTVKIFKYYRDELWKGGYKVSTFQKGIEAIRDVMTSGHRPAVVRLYDKTDVDFHYGSVKLEEGEAFMFFVVYGPNAVSEVIGSELDKIVKSHGAEYIGTKAVDNWFENRNNECDIIGTEQERVKFRETRIFKFPIEICASWDQIGKVYEDVKENLPIRIPNIALLGAHGSHSYSNGTNLYFVARLKIDNPEQAQIEQYALMDALCEIVLNYDHAGIVHHHGIGKMRVGRIKEELGTSFMLLRSLKDTFDPNGIMNPGCLLPLEVK